MPYIFTLTTGADQSISINCVNYGTFFYNYGQPQRNNINSLQKKKIYQKFGGGHGPPAPPWLRHWPLDMTTCPNHLNFLFSLTVVNMSSQGQMAACILLHNNYDCIGDVVFV